ncbi:hypothetical protein [Faecalibacter sp. LW9]|uniref:hypothetical protein n=1 Tax=Faecalibacter sp. LW9 TaxID=3103144 RepID=UPI002B001343|nr:hypothetical protein [Faecalibacter sp. LW9]
MSFEISIQEFNRQFQLYQKKDRYNLNLHEFDLNHFIVMFFNEEIEDLFIKYACKEKNDIKKCRINLTSFSDFFESVENLLHYHVLEVNGYFTKLDLYFIAQPQLIEVNYITRELIFEVVDRLLNGVDCNYKSRLKTELLINMEFD